MNDINAVFKKLVMPLKQLGFHSERPLLPIVRELTQYMPLSEEAKLLLSASLAADLMVEEDFDDTASYIQQGCCWYGVYFDSVTSEIVFTSEDKGELLRVNQACAPDLPVPINPEYHQVYQGYLLKRQLIRQHDIVVITPCPPTQQAGGLA
ncbi:hypothetical protein [Arsukibacterium perlucidum]|uniref:hypothetical protein n=1 Tax=Arsukibacterium perlucidum TaxID=368811 RepID=UPI00035C4517|nr:hypothetical protein [Arsukibacterium perlucidum]